jgi:TolA-binding protein
VPLMRFRRSLHVLSVLCLTLGVATSSAVTARAEPPVTAADIQRLMDRIGEVSKEVAEVRQKDADLGTKLQADLDAAKEKAADFKARIQRNEPIDRNEFVDTRNRVEDVSASAREKLNSGFRVQGSGSEF